MLRRNALAALLMLVCTVLAGLHATVVRAETKAASPEITLPDPLTPDAINALVSRLSDQEVRDLLLKQLDAVAKQQASSPPAPTTEDLPDFVLETTRLTLASLGQSVMRAPTVFSAELNVLANYVTDMRGKELLAFVGIFLLSIALGVGAEIALYRYVVTGRIPVQDNSEQRGIFEVLPILAKRLLRELSGTIVFFVVAGVVLNSLMPAQHVLVAHIVARNLIVLPRIALALLRFFLAPKRPDLRLVHTDDVTARFLFRNLFGVSLAIGLALALLKFNESVDAQYPADGVGFWLNLIIFVWLAFIFFHARRGLQRIMLGRHQNHTEFELKVARYYPWFAVIIIIGTWLMSVVFGAMGQDELLKDGRHLISLAVLLIAPLLDTVIRAVVLHFTPPMRGEGRVAARAYESNLRAYTRMGRVLVFGIVIIVTAKLWDVTPMSMASAGMGEQIAAHVIQALLICAVGYIIWEITRLLINRRLANEMTSDGNPAASESDEAHTESGPSSRLGTVLPPVSWALQAVIITLTVLTALGNLGIDVTPLLAGAGIAGIAIGFGAQKLVSDVMSGLFFLIDDAFRLNEYIDVGGVQGTVERISIRSIQLRDSKGPVLIIPYSNIKTVTNFGRDWGIMKLKFTVPFDTDVEKVRKIFKKIGQEMMDDPVLAPGFIEPFKSQGVGEFNEYGIVVRGKFMHKPGAQFGIRKYIFKRVPEEFAANGIQFARREVKVSVTGSGGEHLTEEQTHQVGAAAAEIVAAEERAKAEAAAKAKA